MSGFRFLELEKNRFPKIKTIEGVRVPNVWWLGLDTTFMTSKLPAGWWVGTAPLGKLHRKAYAKHSRQKNA
jgi:hypothetical protein